VPVRIAALLLALAAGAAACDGEPPPEALPTPRTPPPECPNQDDAVADEALRRPGSLAGDVTGDGSEEEVTIAFDPDGSEECRAFLIVEIPGELHALNIVQQGMFDVAPELGLPRLRTLAPIDEREGAEIVVDVLAGAAAEFVAVFSMGSGVLERMRMSEELPPAEDAFASGGSVGHFSGADCAEGGLVVYSTAEPREDQYTVERRFLRTEEGAFVYDSSRDERHRLAFEEIPVRFGEFRFTPFGSCG
jgi:hypothetical protein